MPDASVLHLNTRGRLVHQPSAVMAAVAAATAARGGRRPLVLLFSETWVRPGCSPPPLQGYSLIVSIPSPPAGNGRGRGGVAIYVSTDLVGRAQQWGEGREGVAWVRVQGVLDRPLFLAACYVPPQQSSVQLSGYFSRLLRDVLAAHEAGGYVGVGGDINGRTGGASEAAAGGPLGELGQVVVPLRESRDSVRNPQGRALLEFCEAAGLWIGNGRLPGDFQGEWTFHSLSSAGDASVADYFLLDSDLITRAGMGLRVHPPAELLDHSAIELLIGGTSLAAHRQQGSGLGRSPAGEEYRVSEGSLQPFAEAAAEREVAWGVVTVVAEAAQDMASLTGAVEEFDRLVAECARQAGMRRASVQRQPGWVQRVARSPCTAALRRRRRQALSRGDRVLAAELNRQACAEARKRKRQHKRATAKRLRELRQSDPARFARELRGREQGPADSISGDEFLAHFEPLLGRVPEGGERAGLSEQREARAAGQAALGEGGVGLGTQAREARERLQHPFTQSELSDRVGRLRPGKSVFGALKPAMLKCAMDQLAAPLLALLNACVRVGCIPRAWAVSALVPIRKPGANHTRPDGYRGIALSTLPAKLFGGILADRFTQYAEEAGLRAAGQAGFRPGYGCSDQIFTVRALVERQRARGQRLYVCYVDFKQAFDRVPRDFLWGKLQRAGFDGWSMQAVQALYADVPMCVKLSSGYTRCFSSLMGVKQGCPLSPTLFGLYLDDFQQGLEAAVGVEAAALPAWESGVRVPVLFYADDQALIATSPEGLQRQLEYLASYSAQWGLTVNTVKTKVVVYAAAAPEGVPEFSYQGTVVEQVPAFRYLGVQIHTTHAFCTAAAARAAAGKQAAHLLRRRMAGCGLDDPVLAMQLFDEYVRPVMSYGAEVWGPQLVTRALSSGQADACERVHLDFLRQLLGVRDTSPTLAVLAETGRFPIAVQWAVQTSRFVNRLVQLDDSRVAKQALVDNVALVASGQSVGRGRQAWAAEVADMFGVVGGPLSFRWGGLPGQVDIDGVAESAASRHFARYTHASVMVQRYQEQVLGAAVEEESYGPASYLHLPVRRQRRAVARVRLGCSSWLAEDVGRTQRVARGERSCPHCGAQLQSAQHAFFECPFYEEWREEHSDLFTPDMTLAEFYQHGDQQRVARFVEGCQRLVEAVGQ